jgi:RNA polymerase sigma-70 factor (ECF subfamily)
VTATDPHRAIDAVFRIEQAKLIAGLTRMVRDVGVAEELAQEALVAALEQWPRSGIPERPGAWLMASAKHRAIDYFRRNKLLERKHKELGYELELEQEASRPDLDAALDDDIGDDLLRLVLLPAIRFFPPKRVSPSRCACLAGCRLTRSREPFSFQSRPFNSASCGPSAR